MRSSVIALFAVLLLSGCAPKVVVDMFSDDLPPVAPDSVKLLRPHQQVPPNTLAIGDVKVVDNGFSIRGSLERVLEMAVDATAQHGGNGLVVTEVKLPDGRSSIHRLWGTMLSIPPEGLAWMERQKADSAAMERQRREEYLRHQANVQQQQATARRIDSLRKTLPRNFFRVGVGPSLLVSKYQVGQRTYKSRVGIDLQADYEHVWPSGFGFGINYLHNSTSFDDGLKTSINYIGPSFVMGLMASNLRLDVQYGMGYSAYTEKCDGLSVTAKRMGMTMRMGLEWRVAKHWALGVDANLLTVSLKKPDDVEQKKGEFYGIRHFGLHGGLCFYF